MTNAELPNTRDHFRRAMTVLGPFIGLIFVVLIFGALEPDSFLSTRNFKTVAIQTVIVALGAIGMTFVIMSGGIDLSVGSVMALSSVTTALLLNQGFGPFPSLVMGTFTGTLCGLINGLLITSLRLVPFIATLGMMGIARGASKLLAGEQKIDVPEPGWLPTLLLKNPEPSWLLVSPIIWITLILAIIMGIVLRRTSFGTHTIAIGSNESTARLCGVRVGFTKIMVYGLSGTFAGLAGVVTFARLSSGNPTVAVGKELDVIAAVVIGGGSLAGGEGSILGALIGALVMAFLANGCNLTDVPTSVQDIIIGLIIVTAVAIDRFRHRK